MRNDDNIDKVLERSFPSASGEQVESARDRIYERVRSTETPEVKYLAITRISRWRWPVAVAAAATLLIVATLWIRTPRDQAYATLQTPEGSVYRAIAGKLEPIHAGEKIKIGDVLRSSDNSDAAIALGDGSRLEIRRKSELSLEQVEDGIKIHLDHGGVIVKAAKQKEGRHFRVQTRDVVVSVVGTVFFVNAEAEGSRVAVYEGEVRVQQGLTETKLGPGEEVATNPRMLELPLEEAVKWSPETQTRLAPSPPAREAFEEVSIRLASGPAQPGQRGGAVNVNIGGCSGGAAVEIDPRRLAMSYKNIYTVIATAYFTGSSDMTRCQYVSRLGLLTGGPSWIQTDGYDIQAVIPEGTFTTRPTLNDPKLLKMMQTMLEERFKIAVSRQMKEMPVYVMTLKEPTKYAAAKGPVWLTKTMAEQRPETAEFWPSLEAQIGLVAQEGTSIYGANATMSDLAILLGRLMGQPIVDRTGFTGRFHFSVYIFRDGPPLASPLSGPRNPIEIKSIITEFEKAGVKLELTKEKVEVLNIDRIERPSEN
jgi:uncharacterized protein (TIGR03435 family)